MIRETIAAIGLASRRAVADAAATRAWKTQVAQVREWSFAMPIVFRVTVSNGPIHQVYLSPSRMLLQRLGNDGQQRQARLDQIMQAFKVNLLDLLPARRPIVNWEQLPVTTEPRYLRGVRSFILRHRGEVGNLYLMADLASRLEFESRHDEQWVEQIGAQLLAADLGRAVRIEDPDQIDRVMTYLVRCEHDVELMVPAPDGSIHSVNGVVMGQRGGTDSSAWQLSVDLDRESGVELTPGLELEGAFGAAERVFRFRSRYLGPGSLHLDGLGELPVRELSLPRRFHLDQRRRYFRVSPTRTLAAWFTVLGGGEPAERSEAPTVEAEVEDLSFSGMGLVCRGTMPAGVSPDTRLRVTVTGLAQNDELAITAVVRRVHRQPVGRHAEVTLLGLEFLVTDSSDRAATQTIRQYVMARQRCQLSERRRDLAGSRP